MQTWPGDAPGEGEGEGGGTQDQSQRPAAKDGQAGGSALQLRIGSRLAVV